MLRTALFFSFVLIATTAYSQVPSGLVLNLDGAGDFLTVPDSPSLVPTQNLTVEAMVRPFSATAPDSAIGKPIFTKWKSPSGSFGTWFLTMNPNTSPVFATSADGIDGQPPLISTGTMPLNEWRHLAAVYDGAQDMHRIYVDGLLVGSGLGHGGLAVSTSRILVGAAIYSKGSFFFHGEIDDVRVWNVVRSQSQINATKAGALPSAYYTTADSGLVGYWTFEALEDLGVGGDGADDVRDLSVFQNHGDLVGQATVGSPTVVSSETAGIPELFLLEQNYPNPFNPSTRIPFSIDRAGPVRLSVVDVFGRVVAELLNETITAGTYEVTFDGRSLASGMYIYRLEAGNQLETRLMTLLK